jgi:hypothetical protein
MSIELTKEQQCTLMANAEYQKIVPIIMNLATLSLALPFVFIKEFQSSLGQKAPVHDLWPWAVAGWAFLAVSLTCGCLFHFASAKLVKAIYGGYDKMNTPSVVFERRFEKLRDHSGELLVPFFLLGMASLLVFVGQQF